MDSNVHFPLMTIIEYGGYRILASAQLPLDSTTLIYVNNKIKKF